VGSKEGGVQILQGAKGRRGLTAGAAWEPPPSPNTAGGGEGKAGEGRYIDIYRYILINERIYIHTQTYIYT